MIVPGSTSQALAASLAEATGEPLAEVAYERFPDGELLSAAPGFDADRAVVVAATTSSDAHLEVLQLQDAVREAGASEVVTVLPYMGYARQDAPMKPGESRAESPAGYPCSARAVARAISVGADRVLTVAPHEDRVCEFFEPTATAVEAAGRLAEPLPADLYDPVFLAPDAGAIDLADAVRRGYGAGDTDHFEKRRHSGTEVEVTPGDVVVDGRDVVVVDDIVATGTTMGEAVGVLREHGAERIIAACVHPLLVGGAVTRLRRAGVDRIVGTDTIERPVSAVSAAPAIAEHL